MSRKKDIEHTQSFRLVKKEPISDDEKYRRSRERWDRHARTREIAPAPLHVDIETTNLCDLKCIMCEGRSMKRSKGMMSMDLFERIIRECNEIGVDSVKLGLWGEPLLNKRLPDMIRFAKENSSLILQFNTTANLMTEAVSRTLIEAGLDHLTVSIDGVSAETYERIRIGGKFERVLRNVERLIELKRELGSALPCVTVQIIRMTENRHETERFVEYWEGKADRISITNIGVIAGSPDVASLSLREAKRIGRRPCTDLWHRLSVHWNGDVSACCSDFDGFLKVGRLGDSSLLDIWHGSALTELRRRHEKGDFSGLICERCEGTVDFAE